MLNLSKDPAKEAQIQHLELWRDDSKSFSHVRRAVFGEQTFSASCVLEHVHRKAQGALRVGDSPCRAGELRVASLAVSLGQQPEVFSRNWMTYKPVLLERAPFPFQVSAKMVLPQGG